MTCKAILLVVCALLCAPDTVLAVDLIQAEAWKPHPSDSVVKDIDALTHRCQFLEERHVAAADINALGRLLINLDKSDFAKDCLDALYGRIGIDVSAAGYAELSDALALKWGDPQAFASYGTLRGDRLDFGPDGRHDAARSRIGLPPLSSRKDAVAAILSSGRWFELQVAPLALARPSYPTRPRLRAQLAEMMRTDQAARSKGWPHLKRGQTRRETMASVDAENVEKLRKIVKSIGFPSAAEVGRNGVEAFFLVSQHAVSDIPLMKHVLSLSKPLLENGDLAPVYYALLTDRLKVFDGQCQLYGTQSWASNGQQFLYPIQDSPHLNERRRQMLMAPVPSDVSARERAPSWRKIDCPR